MLQEAGHINNTVVLTILTFLHIQCLHLMYDEVAWVLVSLGTQVQPQIIPDPDYFQTIFPFLMVMFKCKSLMRFHLYPRLKIVTKTFLKKVQHKSTTCPQKPCYTFVLRF